MNPVTGVPDDYKNPSLRRWRVIEVVSLNGSRTRHVYGHDVTNDAGRASSAIKEFDRGSMIAVTHSGRSYKLLGAPGKARSGESAWENWSRKSVVVSETDVTNEYFSAEKLFAKGSPIDETSHPQKIPYNNKEQRFQHLKQDSHKPAEFDRPASHFFNRLSKVKALSKFSTRLSTGYASAMANFLSASITQEHHSVLPSANAITDNQFPGTGETPMTYRFSKRLALLQFSAAFAMVIALYLNAQPRIWGWLLFLPFFLFVILQAVRTYRYSLTINGDNITLVDIERARYPVSDIAAINVWPAKGDRIAVVTFSDRRKFSFPGHLEGFDDLVALLRNASSELNCNT